MRARRKNDKIKKKGLKEMETSVTKEMKMAAGSRIVREKKEN